MSVCRNCHREIDGEARGGFYAGPFLFCSPMCRDTSEELRQRERTSHAFTCAQCGQWRSVTEYHDCPANSESARAEGEANRLALMRSQCSLGDACFVCSGAMRERAGKGDQSQ